MLGRMIPANVVQDHLKEIINDTPDDGLTTPQIYAVFAAQDMGLLTVDKHDPDGVPTAITWLNV